VTRASETTGTENLLVVFDLGDTPKLSLVGYQCELLSEVHSALAVLSRKYASGSGTDPWGAKALTPELLIKRMSLASPWEMVLTQAISGTPYATAAAAGALALRALRYVLELKKDWDSHQLEMQRGRMHLDELQHDYAEVAVLAAQRMLAEENGGLVDSASPDFDLVMRLRFLQPVTQVETISDDDPRA
jgi:hypothetical protein